MRVKLEYDITRTVGNLYTQKEVDDKLASKSLDPLQEYCCKFKLGSGSILSSVKDDERTTGWNHWDDVDDDSNDDNGHDNGEEDSAEECKEKWGTKRNAELKDWEDDFEEGMEQFYYVFLGDVIIK